MHSVPPTLIPNAATRRTGAQCRDGHHDEWSVPEHVEREFRRYLECGRLAHGIARARCGQCGHGFLIAFSCKGRAVCPSCNSRRMVATAAHLTDPAAVRDILAHLGEPTAPPRIAPARGPPRWASADAEHDPATALPLPPAPAYEFDQRIAW